MIRSQAGVPPQATCPPTESPRVSLGDLALARGLSSDSDRDLAGPMTGKEQPAPPQHEHNFDKEGSRHEQPMSGCRNP
jgi:hypothetical protein